MDTSSLAYRLALGVNAAGGVLIIALVILLVVERTYRAARDARLVRHEAHWEQLVGPFLAVGKDPGPKQWPVRPGLDTAALQTVLLKQATYLRGSAGHRCRQAFEETGLVAKNVDLLRHRSGLVRAAAARRLALMRSPVARGPLFLALDDANWDVRMAAARALISLRDMVSLRRLVAQLEQPTRFNSLRVAEMIVEMGSAAIPVLTEALPATSPAVQRLLVDILGDIGDRAAVPALLLLLSHTDAEVRTGAANALGRIGALAGAPGLARLLTDEAWFVRAAAAKALGRLRAVDSVPELAKCLRDSEWWVRLNSAEAMLAMGEEGAETLCEMVADPDGFARDMAVQTLEAGDVLARCADALASPKPQEAAAARDRLHRLLLLRPLKSLEDLAQSHPNPAVRAALAEIIPGGAAP